MSVNGNMTLEQVLTLAKSMVDSRLAEMAASLDNETDNPGILKREKKGYVISSAALGTTSWEPFYHDWLAQYKQVKEYLENALTDSKARTSLKSLCEHGNDNYKGYKRTYHPHVTEQLNPLLAETIATLNLWFQKGEEVSNNIEP